MFGKKRIIIYFDETTVTVFQVHLGKKPTVKTVASYPWTKETLPEVLQQVRKRSGKVVRILLDDYFVYTVSFAFPVSATQLTREAIRLRAQDIIPEDLTKTVWDYKSQLFPKKANADQPEIFFQVVALVQQLFQTFEETLSTADFHIEAISSVSTSLEQIVDDPINTILYIYVRERSILVLTKQGIVISTHEYREALTLKSIETFLSYAEKTSSYAPTKIVITGQQLPFDAQQLASSSRVVTVEDFHPAVGLAMMKDLKGRDDQVLNLLLSSEIQSPSVKVPVATPKEEKEVLDEQVPSQKRTMLTIVMVVLLLVGIIGFTIFQYTQNSEQKRKKEETISPAPSAVASPTKAKEKEKIATEAAKINVASYEISILNGSGREGEAGKLQERLEKEGFIITSVGNAETSDYEKTEISYKKDVPREFKLVLDKVMSNFYDITVDNTLVESSSTDITITIGQHEKTAQQ